MKTLPLSFAMVVGTPPPSIPAPEGAASFAATLSQHLGPNEAPAVEATPDTVVRTVDLAPLLGMSAGQPLAAPETFAGAGALPAGAGIFGYGRSGMFDTTGRALIDQSRPAVVPSGRASAPAATNLRHNFKQLLGGLAREFDVPESFITAVMLAESGGDPNAVGDHGHSVGLFQLHDRGMGYGMGDDRYDPAKNARVGVAGLASSWHEGVSKGLSGEALVRFAYDDKFNPGGGWAYQGDRVVANWRALEAGSGASGRAFAPSSLAWPVSNGRVTQHSDGGHDALDIGVAMGTPVRAVAPGTVVEVERLATGYGWYVTVDHGGGWQTRYAHASEIRVHPGDSVAAGQVLMLSGNTGKSTGPHLHFEVLRDGERLAPEDYLSPR